MKFLDDVSVIEDRDSYKINGVIKGMEGTIIDAEIRDNCFHVIFVDPKTKNPNFNYENDDWDDDILCSIKIEDLKLVKDNGCSDEWILDAIPKNNPQWWCKVEDGYITNLKGERKNKIPYDYNS